MSNQLQNIKRLLSEVNAIIEKADEIARLKGENFNIFSILGIETKENKTHSNFLAAILDPGGPHGLGDIFLKLFLDELKNTELTNKKPNILDRLKNSKEIKVETETYLGRVDFENQEGGRVDITISAPEGKIYIENKINAGDQYLQIARYCKNHPDENKIVLYLTLDGKEPSEDSTGKHKDGKGLKAGKDFFLLSYQTNIINWLEKCQKEASDVPIIRETIKQYIILIKKLTGQLTDQKMEKEILELLIQNIESTETIVKLYGRAKYEFYSKTLDRLTNELTSQGIPEANISRERSNRTDGLFIKLIELKNFDIGINLELENNFFFFCAVQKGKNRQPSINLHEEFNNLYHFLTKNLKIEGRCKWALIGTFKISNCLDKKNNSEQLQAHCKELASQIKKVIEKSKIYDYKENND